MSLSDKKGIDKQLLIFLGIICILIIFAVYYVEHREINDAYALAGRILDTSKDVGSYQFDMHSNISMLGESFTLIKGNGSVDYTNRKMSVKLKSMEDSMDLIVVDENAYSRSNGKSWEKRKLNQQTWDNYDQLSQMNLLLANSTDLSMEKTDSYLILTALPDNSALIQEAEKAGLELKGDEHLTEYSIRYLIERDSYHIMSIESHTEFMINIQGLMSPVAINNRVYVYNYNSGIEIEEPIILIR
ncbi:hypothetical protein [uncultured Methanolobus sp.]|uniref:hypothetical protein n=1 Tax=uncultured Methanolobus sp. TaxID=218300 RepID=UPI0029C9AFF9|nr:hypothetical protein [uncultured Methanolobus sp.]